MRHVLVAATLAALCAVGAHAAAPDSPSTDARTFTDADGFHAEELPGGYQPASSPLSSAVTPNTKVVFVPQALNPTEAYPPPAPPKSYPRCNKQQQDDCLQH